MDKAQLYEEEGCDEGDVAGDPAVAHAHAALGVRSLAALHVHGMERSGTPDDCS